MSSVVFRALKADARGHFKHSVAIKLLKNISDLQQLQVEFSALTKLRSNHCVAVWGWETFNEGPALVLEYVDGITLEKLSRHGLDLSLIEEVVAQIQKGLVDIGEQHLFHGDLSPNNVLIARDGIVKLVDFGLNLQNKKTAQLGSPGFLAPERLSGTLPNIDADKYSLGLIYHWLCELASLPTQNKVAPLMCIDPLQRNYIQLRSSSEQRARLATLVNAALLPKSQRTVRLPKPRLRSLSPVLVVAVVALLFLSFQVASRFLDQQVLRQGFLQVRSNQWVKIHIDGKDYGYAPLDLSLPQGVHAVHWKTATHVGERTVEIQDGRPIRLHDADFRE